MFKISIKLCVLLFYGLIGIIISTAMQAPFAQAAPQKPGAMPTVTLTQENMPNPSGHAGAIVHISLQNFTPSTAATPNKVNIYTTSSPDVNQCTSPASAYQAPFTGATPVTIQQDGTFDIDVRWPTNAKNTGTGYFVCAISTTVLGEKAVSGKSFLFAADVTAAPSKTSLNPGDQLTITGDNWLPPQTLTVNIESIAGQTVGTIIATQDVTPDGNGHFVANLTIDPATQAGQYAIDVLPKNGAGTRYTKDKVITINAQATATPSPTVTPTLTPTPMPTPTPTPPAASTPTDTGTGNTGGNGGGGGTVMTLIFTLGGSGILLLIVGLIMFASATPSSSRVR